MPFGTLEEMPSSFSFFNQRPHTSASLLRSHLDPCDSAVSVKTKQTASPPRPLLQCSVVLSYLSLQGDGSGMGRRDALEHWVAASCRLAPPCRTPLPLAAPARAGLCPYHHTRSSSQARTKSPGGWTWLTEGASVTGWVTGTSSSRGKSHVRCPTRKRGIFSIVSAGLEPQ